MEDIEDLLVQMEQELHDGRRSVFGSGVTVDGDAMLALVDRIRANLPDVIREARNVVATSERRRQEETQRAQNMIMSAEQRADEILSDHAIIAQAEREAQVIRSQALEYQERIKESVSHDIGIVLSDTEAALVDALKIIRLAKNSV